MSMTMNYGQQDTCYIVYSCLKNKT